MRHNEGEMDEFRHLAAGLGAERIRFKTFNLHMSGTDACDSGIEFLPAQAEHSRYTDSRGRTLKNHLTENYCKWPWERVVMNCDGQVVPCCNDFDSRFAMGDIFEQRFSDIWFGTRYNTLRRNVLERWRDIPLCVRCPVPDRVDLSFERFEQDQQGNWIAIKR